MCINTAIVYMQRFYMFHSFTKFHRNYIAAAALFLAAKVISDEFVIIAEEIKIFLKFGGLLKSQ